VEISIVTNAAVCWEERAKSVLECAAPISEFEEVLRYSTVWFCTLPSSPVF